MNSSDEPIVPKANQRVIDSEVVKVESNKHEDSRQKTANQAGKTSPEKKTVGSKIKAFFAGMRRVMLATIVIAAVVLLYWWYDNNQSDWEVEKINQLQVQVGQLKKDVTALKSAQTELQSQTNSASKAGSIDDNLQAQLAKIDDLSQRLGAFETQLSSIKSTQTASSETGSSESNASANQPTTVSTDSGTQEQVSALKDALTQVQSQLAQVQETQAAQAKDNAKQSKEEPTTVASNALNSMQIQRWMLQINTQWMLNGDASRTLKALQVLEQTVGASDFEHKNRVLRQIGEDMNRLKTTASQPPKPTETIKTLRQWIIELPWEDMSPLGVTVPHETSADAQQAPLMSAWERLKDKMGALFTVKKRDEKTQLTHVERIVQQDVLKERALLMLDRLEWALTTGSDTLFERSKQTFAEYMIQTFPEKSQAFKTLFEPIQTYKIPTQKPLTIVEGL